MQKDCYRPGTDGMTKEVLKGYLIKTYGKSKYFMSYNHEGKNIKVAFTGEYHVLANFNTGAMIDKKSSD